MTGIPNEVRVPISLRWRDMDMLGHLNQAVYHELLEEGRAALFAKLRAQGNWFPFVIVRVELDYRHEVRRDHGQVEVVVRPGGVGGKSVTLEHEVVLPDGTIAAEGRTVLVAWDMQSRGARELSARERAWLGDPQLLLTQAYEAFNARDIDTALELMHEDVDWPNGMEGGRVRGRDAVREYWTRQFTQIDSRVTPHQITVEDGGARARVDVHQVVRTPDGEPLSDGRVAHVYALRDGLVERMDIDA
jgi:acyl-CoA thioester hydrolase